MSLARSILSNTLAQIIGKVFVALLGIGVVKITSGYLSLTGIGEYATIYEFLAFFGIAADLGLFTIAVREMSRDEKKIPMIIGNILSLRTILVILTMLLAIATAFLIPKYQETRIPLGVAIAALTVFFTILNGTISSVLQVKLKMQFASLTTVLGKIVTLGFMVYTVFWGFPAESDNGFYMLLFAGVLGNLVMFLSTSYYVRKITPIKYRFDISLWKEVLIKSLPYGIALILNAIYFRIDTLLIGFIRGQAEVGIYAVAMKILEHITILPLYFMNSVLPVLTKKINEKSDQYKKIIRYSFDFLTSLSIPMVVGTVLLAYPIIFVAADEKLLSRVSEGFYGTDIALQILIFALLFQFLNILFAFILIALDKQSRLLYINAVGVVFNIVTNIIFIPKYGFIGAAITSVISELIILIATYFTAKKYLEFSVNLKNTVKIIVSSLIMGVFIFYLQPFTYQFLQNWNLFILIPLAMVIYLGMLFISGAINRDMLDLIKKPTPEILPSDNPSKS